MNKRCWFTTVSVALLSCLLISSSEGQSPESDSPSSAEAAGTPAESEATTEEATTETESQPNKLRFSFQGVAWREVIRWLADEADLALHVSDLPTGSFTYSDPSGFTPDEAIARVNLFLIPQGFTLVRSGQLLSLINLADARSQQQLSAIASLVKPEQLDSIPDHDVVKTLFPLGETEASDAVDELEILNLMTSPDVLSRTNQLMVIDTAQNLRNVRQILDAFRSDQMANGTIVESFTLEHVDAEDVFVVARPHLGLATGEMIGIDVSVSTDPSGKQIFVTGVKDKVKLLENLVTAIDQPKARPDGQQANNVLQTHPIEGGNTEMVYNVLQTMLAGRDVRLSMDETAGTVVALAPLSVQNEIQQTVQQLKASDADFEVIPLRHSDPYFVVTLLTQMLDLPDTYDDPDDIDPDAPRIDADPTGKRLFVRAKPAQIEQIKKIVEGLDGVDNSTQADETFRILPLYGTEAEQTLDTAAKFWREENPIVLYGKTPPSNDQPIERVIGEEADSRRASDARASDGRLPVRTRSSKSAETRWLTTDNTSNEPLIRCQVTKRGLLLQSDDSKALEKFVSHVRTIAGPDETAVSPPIVFYLKYTRAIDALRMLAELLEGGAAASPESAGSLVNGYVASDSTFYSTFVTADDGTVTLTADSVTVVADPRLNRLIAQGTSDDIEQIQDYLEIVDKDSSLTSVETYGKSNVIELLHTRASDVAESLKVAFAGQVTEEKNEIGQVGGGRSPRDGERQRDDRGDGERRGRDNDPQRNRGGGGEPIDLEPKMTIAVHEASNSLIVTAPDTLFAKVEALARQIDSRAEQAVEVVVPSNGAVFEAVLQQVMLGETNSRSGSSRRRSSRDSDDDRRR